MKAVQTIRGVFDRALLQVALFQRESVDGLLVGAEWRLIEEGPDGACVKRDSHTVVYATPGEQAQAKLLGLGPVVNTARGLIPRDQLQVSFIFDEGDNSLTLVTEWRIKSEGVDAPHVRRDANGCFLATPELQIMASLGQVPSRPSVPGADVTIGLSGAESCAEQANIR